MVYESTCAHCDEKIPDGKNPDSGYRCYYCGQDPFDYEDQDDKGLPREEPALR